MEFLQKIDCTIFHELQLPLCCFSLFKIWWGHRWILCLQKGVQLSSVLLLLHFMKFFLSQSKTKNTMKDINQNFTSNKLNEKKSEYPFSKKANLWIIDALTDFFGNFYGKLELFKVKKCSLVSNCFLCTVLLRSANYFLMKSCDMLLINRLF